MPFPNEHAARIAQPGRFKRARRKNNEFGKGIDVIFGVLDDGRTEVQAIRFKVSEFTVDQARAWLKDHDYKPIEFEPALTTEGLVLEAPVEVTPRFGGRQVQAHVKDGKAQIFSKSGEDVTNEYLLTAGDLARRFGNAVLDGEIIEDAKLVVSQVLYLGKQDLHGVTLESEREYRTSLKDSLWVKFENGIVVTDSAELEGALAIFSKLPGYETSVLKRLDSVYPLDGKTSLWLEARRTWSLAAEVVQVHRIAESDAYNYLLTVSTGVGIKVPLGRVYNVRLEKPVPLGGIVRVVFESLDRYTDPRTNRFWFNAWRPRVVEHLEDRSSTDEALLATELVQESGGILGEEKPYPGRFYIAIGESCKVHVSQTYQEYLQESYPILEDLDSYEASLLEYGYSEDDLAEARRSAIRAAREEELYWDDYFNHDEVVKAQEALHAPLKGPQEVSEAEAPKIPPGGTTQGTLWSRHWRDGLYAHLDHRFKVDGVLNGWVIDDQPPLEEVKAAKEKLGLAPDAPVDTEDVATKLEAALDWRFDPKKPDQKLLVFPEADTPTTWLDVSGKVGTGELGGTDHGPGFFFDVQKGTRKDLGVQQLFFREYFEDGPRYKGRWIVRRIPARNGSDNAGKDRLVWVAWFSKATKDDQIPYILTRRGRMKRDWVPPAGVPGISQEYQKKIPSKLQWWTDKNLGPGERLDLIDQAYNWLAENDPDFPFRPVQAKESARIMRFSVTRTTQEGAAIPGLPKYRWSLFLYAGQCRLFGYQFDQTPLDFQRVTGQGGLMLVDPPEGCRADWLNFEGELPPGAGGNSSKRLAASCMVLDCGDVTVLDWDEGARSWSLDFSGSRLKGQMLLEANGAPDGWDLARMDS